MTDIEVPVVDVQEKRHRLARFKQTISTANDDYNWIIANEAWTADGHETYADWWMSEIHPIMTTLSMRPTREIVAAGIEQVRREEADLPPAYRRTQREIGDMFGVSDDTVARAVGARSPQPANAAGGDLEGGVAAATDRPEASPTTMERGDGRSAAQLIVQSITNEWYTPNRYIDAARKVLGGVDLDPASCEEANRTVHAAKFYSKEDDGLARQWRGRVWLNPPYGRLAGDFATRLVDEYTTGNVSAAVILVNAHCTDTRWFQPLWDHVLCFTDHRIDFSAGTDDRSGSTHGSVFVYLGPHRRLFANTFTPFGAIVERFHE